jgi:hypothetical protein
VLVLLSAAHTNKNEIVEPRDGSTDTLNMNIDIILKSKIFWDVTLFNLVENNRLLGGTYRQK